VLNRKPGAGEALVELAQTVKGAGQGVHAGPRLARVVGGQAPLPRAGQGHHRVRRRRHRGMPRARSWSRRQAAAGGDRRPADERHERGRRPLRRRQDVPAAGGEIGARHEAGGGPPDPLHRGGEAAHRRHQQGPHHHGHGQGRRARHRQEHRRRGARLQRLRGDRPRRHGAGRQDPARGQGARRAGDRPVRPDHALAGGDEPRRRRDEAPGLFRAAADRRRHHQPRPHRDQDRAELRPAGGVCAGRLARRGRGHQAAVDRHARRPMSPRSPPTTRRSAPSTPTRRAWRW
jgi:hypothetical protein